MSATYTQTQGIAPEALRTQALRVLSTLPEEQLLVVIAYARALLGDYPTRPQTHPIEELVEEQA